jgi:hypothetical protein
MNPLAGFAVAGVGLAFLASRLRDHNDDALRAIESSDRIWNRLFDITVREPGFFVGSEARKSRKRSCATIEDAIRQMEGQLRRADREITHAENSSVGRRVDPETDGINDLLWERLRSVRKLSRATSGKCKRAGRPSKFIDLSKTKLPRKFLTDREKARLEHNRGMMRRGL